MDSILSSITIAMLRIVEEQLSNDEISSDAELVDHFIENGLTAAQAQQALTYRSRYSRNIYLDGFTPILKGEQALRFNPTRRQFEPV
jgi:hypothetical protein